MRDAISVANAESLRLPCAVLSVMLLLSEQNYELVVCAAAMACTGQRVRTVPLPIKPELPPRRDTYASVQRAWRMLVSIWTLALAKHSI